MFSRNDAEIIWDEVLKWKKKWGGYVVPFNYKKILGLVWSSIYWGLSRLIENSDGSRNKFRLVFLTLLLGKSPTIWIGLWKPAQSSVF